MTGHGGVTYASERQATQAELESAKQSGDILSLLVLARLPGMPAMREAARLSKTFYSVTVTSVNSKSPVEQLSSNAAGLNVPS